MNTLHNHLGNSPAQIVFGIQPNLPDTITMTQPMQRTFETHHECVAGHRAALYAARSAYYRADVIEKINTALRTQIREEPVYVEMGEWVHYNREKGPKTSLGWRGPAQVVGFKPEGTVLLEHHGMRISASNRRIFRVDGVHPGGPGDEYTLGVKRREGVEHAPRPDSESGLIAF